MDSVNRHQLASGAARAKEAWHEFLQTLESLRPDLFRYCRHLTRDVWDAEDLVQDTLARAFVTLACLFQDIENPRAWLFRVASNIWIDRQRQRQRHEAPHTAADAASDVDPSVAVTTREAGATLLSDLSPQERAAVLLKDVFDFTLEEIAGILTTTTGAVKAALHRGRGKLSDVEPVSPRAVPGHVLDAFCEAFNARDIDRLVALLLDTATADMAGVAIEYGPEKMKRSDTGSLYHSLFSPIDHAVASALRAGDRGGPARVERCDYRGESILLSWYEQDDGPVVRDVIRLRIESDRVAWIRFHFFSPDVLAEICRELRVPFRSNGYRYWNIA
jgi:RNA polymerase sigma-70 factor (ECF subfamily)